MTRHHSPRLRKKQVALVFTIAASMLALAGCGFNGLYGLPLPGGADLGDHPYTVHAEFQDVLDLVPQAGVEVNDVPVGRVDSISLNKSNWTADVTMTVNGDVRLPANVDADLRQSSLLGEKFIELVAPAPAQAQGTLTSGALIPLSRTNRNTEVEEVLGALSLVLNGGGITQLKTITQELDKATSGNEPALRALLANVNALTGELNAHSADITNALDAVNRLSATLAAQRDQIANVLTNLGPGLQVLNTQRDELVTMLQSLTGLSGIAVDTVNKSQADLVADLQALTPTLHQLSNAGANLPNALQVLLTFPFSDAAVAGIRGDYTNLFATIDLNLQDILTNLTQSAQSPLSSLLPSVSNVSSGQAGAPPTQPPPLPLPGTSGTSGPSQSIGSGLSGLLNVLTGGS